MKILLDTTVLVDVLRGKGHGYNIVAMAMVQNSPLLTSVVNVAEIYAGLRDGEEDQARQLFFNLEVLPVTASIAERGGELVRTWARQGRTLALDDMLIAASALEHGLVLATSNVKDFPMPDIRLYQLT